jgi:hypothetical protein
VPHDASKQVPVSGRPTTSDLVQVIAAVLTLILAFVAAKTLLSLLATVLASVATLVLCVAILPALAHRLVRPRWARILTTVIGMILATAAIFVGWIDAPAEDRQLSIASPASDPPLVVQKISYSLVPSSDPFTNHLDKVDLDTGCPGWGPTGAHVGRNRCGDLADLILETDELHSPRSEPRIVVLRGDAQASYRSCREQLSNTAALRGTLSVDGLRKGTQLCVRTDQQAIAAVHLEKVMTGPELVIAFEVWKT